MHAGDNSEAARFLYLDSPSTSEENGWKATRSKRKRIQLYLAITPVITTGGFLIELPIKRSKLPTSHERRRTGQEHVRDAAYYAGKYYQNITLYHHRATWILEGLSSNLCFILPEAWFDPRSGQMSVLKIWIFVLMSWVFKMFLKLVCIYSSLFIS